MLAEEMVLPQRSGTERLILVVEDDSAVRRLMCQMLRQGGHTVLDAADGFEALLLWQSHGDEISLLLTDVVMPGMDGGQLAQQITRIRPEVPVIFVSGYSHHATLHEVLPRGAHFLPKPFNHDTLNRKVRQALSAFDSEPEDRFG
jgi:two-component system cell cycle sensor histidine kinase/response regulator CckA